MESTKNIETEEKQQKCKEDSLLLRSLKTSLVAIVHANLVILLFNSIDLIWIDFIDPVVFMIAAILLVMAITFAAFLFSNKKLFKAQNKQNMPLIYFAEICISYLIHEVICWYIQRTAPASADLGPYFFKLVSTLPYFPVGVFTIISFMKSKSRKIIPTIILVAGMIYLAFVVAPFWHLLF